MNEEKENQVEYESMEDYIDQMIKEGYIDKDLTPLKCSCGCKEFEECNVYRCEMGVEEYSLKCVKCDAIVGHWAYGYWVLD